MINFNGNLVEKLNIDISENRGFLYGDAVFETLKVVNQKVLFLEEHYLRLMASMRICRMEIPMVFTMEFFEAEILKLIAATNGDYFRIRFNVYRNANGFYAPDSNEIEFFITVKNSLEKNYILTETEFEVDLYKDNYLPLNLTSTLKTNNKLLPVLASVYAKENELHSCLMLNTNKNVAEGISGNIFMKTGNVVITPPITEGCLNGIMRKQIIEILTKDETIVFEEKPISAFDLQKADELFLSNVMVGVQSITKYRKKEFEKGFAKVLIDKLNEKYIN